MLSNIVVANIGQCDFSLYLVDSQVLGEQKAFAGKKRRTLIWTNIDPFANEMAGKSRGNLILLIQTTCYLLSKVRNHIGQYWRQQIWATPI